MLSGSIASDATILAFSLEADELVISSRMDMGFRIIGPYRLVRKLSEVGTGEVYESLHEASAIADHGTNQPLTVRTMVLKPRLDPRSFLSTN